MTKIVLSIVHPTLLIMQRVLLLGLLPASLLMPSAEAFSFPSSSFMGMTRTTITSKISSTVINAESSPSDAQIIAPSTKFGSSALPQPTVAATPDTQLTPPPPTTIPDAISAPAPLINDIGTSSGGINKLAEDIPMPLPSNPPIDFDTIALVAGQENYGFGIVLLGEAIWSFSKSPSIDHGVKTLLPAIIAAAILFVVTGPLITSGDAGSIQTGLAGSTVVSVVMGAVYAARLSAPFSPSPKEIAAGGLLVTLAGFFSFSQNLIVDGFVTLPSLPSLPLPSIPTFY